ncbi:hypothetical protein [Paraglaciecola sp. MB-3u-78]|uniref:hypothetical protein n=1 Tax=Paraglaciecola sp. MB-3u-78 TaxID=2058332 RepID=UPI001E63BDA4|nr:hypothetical protein [Paraglaciecola sp. MB-3u-78]
MPAIASLCRLFRVYSINIRRMPMFVLFVLGLSTSVLSIQAEEKTTYDPITGFVIGENYEIVRAHCTACHSAKLVTQNRMTRDNWLETIRWMQKSQGLWPLGAQEQQILDYLETHYSPIAVSRRSPIPSHLLPVLK